MRNWSNSDRHKRCVDAVRSEIARCQHKVGKHIDGRFIRCRKCDQIIGTVEKKP